MKKLKIALQWSFKKGGLKQKGNNRRKTVFALERAYFNSNPCNKRQFL